MTTSPTQCSTRLKATHAPAVTVIPRPPRQPGVFSVNSPLAGYPIAYNIEMDPHDDLIVGGMFCWSAGPPLEVVKQCLK